MKQPASNTRYFYQDERVATVTQGTRSRTLFRTPDTPLAEQQSDVKSKEAGLISTDSNGSVLKIQVVPEAQPHTYTAYGHSLTQEPELSLLAFNGELREANTLYLLGNGYRAYSTTLARFLSPDSWSPFGKAGINTYCYCKGDPINNVDPTGHMKSVAQYLRRNPTQRPQKLFSPDSSIYANIPQKRNAPPSNIAKEIGLSSAVPAPTEVLPPAYSENLQNGHSRRMEVIGGNNWRGSRPPTYSEATAPQQAETPPPQVQAPRPQAQAQAQAQARERYAIQRTEVTEQLERARAVIRSMISKNRPIPQSQIDMLNNLSDQLNVIRGLSRY